VKHQLDVLERARHSSSVTQAGLNKIDVAADLGNVLKMSGRKVVYDANPRAARV
jgi:hypothetical protein